MRSLVICDFEVAGIRVTKGMNGARGRDLAIEGPRNCPQNVWAGFIRDTLGLGRTYILRGTR